jgi:hypothetical protein
VGKEPASISSSSNSNHPLANGQQSTSRFAKKASSLSNGNFQLSAAFITSYGVLKLLPFWDPLRGDPRFEQIVASLAPKERQ